MSSEAPTVEQVYRLFIRATPEQIWEALTEPAFTVRYFHGVHIEHVDGRRRSSFVGGEQFGDEAVTESSPPRRLVHDWRSSYDPVLGAEAVSRVTWEIEPQEPGVCLLTLTHDRLEGAPKTAAKVAGVGWMRVLSGLKTLLETGEPLG